MARTRLLTALLSIFILPAPSPGWAAGIEKAHVGHYYLQGVMEVGSELLLRQNGEFEWAMTYGAVDQLAKGRWHASRDKVILEADRPDKEMPLFQQQPVREWDSQAEMRLLGEERSAEIERIWERCPFREPMDAAFAPASVLDDAAISGGRAELDRKSEASADRLRVAIHALEVAAREAVDARKRNSDEVAGKFSRALKAAGDYQLARPSTRDAYWDAGREVDLPEPVYPAECQFPAEIADSVPRERWKGGYGVMISDPANGISFDGIAVTFVFDDGHHVEATTTRSGWAGARRRPGASLREIMLEFHGKGPDAFKASVEASAVFSFHVNAKRLSAGFEELELRVEGGDLVPSWPEYGEQGRYVR